jgi:hypothetical protein
MPLPFEEFDVSDLDTISTTSTKCSDEQTEYNVEKILTEDRDDNGAMVYLVKWEGYPLHLSTWEPAENLLGTLILPNWEKEKKEIKSGARQPFDLDKFEELQEHEMEKRAERHHRRVAKRRKLGLLSRSGSVSNGSANDVVMRDEASDSDDDEPLATRQKRVKTVIPKRKGMASKAKTPPTRQAAAASLSSGEVGEDDDAFSGFSFLGASRGESRAATGDRALSAASKTTALPNTWSVLSGNASEPPPHTASAVTKQASIASRSSVARKSAASSSSSHVKPTIRPPPNSSARKSAPSTASLGSSTAKTTPRLPVLPTDTLKRKSTGNISITFKPKPGPRTRRMSESDPRQHRFQNLAEQNRFHKHARKEGVPDPSMLGTFNPATGRFDEPVASTSRVESTRSMPSVFGRREAPAPARQKSLSPSSPRIPAPSAMQGDNTTPFRKVCWDWRNTVCNKAPGTCTFAHHYITCPGWKEGNCEKPDRECEFDHCEGRDPIAVSHSGQGLYPPSSNTRQQQLSFQQPRQLSGMSPHQAASSYGEAPATVNRNSIPAPFAPHALMTRPQGETIIRIREITCPEWSAGKCRFGCACRFAHRSTGLNIDFKDITCYFWANGRCSKAEAKCQFAHSHREYLANIPRSGTIVFMPSAVERPNTVKTKATSGTAVSQAQLHEVGPVVVPRSGPMIMDDDHSHVVTWSPSDEISVFRRPSMAVQRPTNGTAFVHDITLAVNLEGDEFETAVKLACFTEQDGTMLAEILGSQRRIEMKRVINDVDLKRWCTDTLQQGARFPTGDVQVQKSFSTRLLENLQFSSGVVITPEFAILVYSGAAEHWEFLNKTADAKSQAPLRFKLLPPISVGLFDKVVSVPKVVSAVPNVPSNVIDSVDDDSASSAARHLLNKKMERLLKINESRYEERVFVMMPESRASEIQLIVGVFEELFKQPDYIRRPCKVWTSAESGSWEKCVAYSACLVLLHPDVPLWDIPHLGKVLQNSSFRFFSIDLDKFQETLETGDPDLSCQRLFPMGDVVFITDDVFLHAPGKALAIIERISKDNAGKPRGATRNQVATRPGIRRWLMDLVVTQEQGKEDPRMPMLLEKICDLCPFNQEDELYPGNPSEKSDLVSLAPEQLPTFQTLLQVDLKRATDYIINWFAGWAFMNTDKVRRFTVCHEEPGTGKPGFDKNYNLVMQGIQADPRGWGDEFKYMLVKTPDEWIDWHEAKASSRRR